MKTQYVVELYKLDVLNGVMIPMDEIITHEGLEWSKKKNAIGSASFSMNINDPKASRQNLIRFATHVIIREYSEGTDSRGLIRWSGPMSKLSGNYQENDGKIIIEANTPLYHFNSRFTSSERIFTAEEQATIMWKLISESQALPNGNLLINQGTIVTGKTRDRTYQYGRISELLMNLSNVIDGNDFTFDERTDSYGAFTGYTFNTYYPSVGRLRDDLNILEISENIQSISFNTRGEVYNNFLGIGAGTGALTLTSPQESTDSEQVFTRREQIYTNKDVLAQSTLDEQTYAALSQGLAEKYDIEITLRPGSYPEYGSFIEGDYLKVDIQKGFMSFNYWAMVKEIKVALDQNGVAMVTPVLVII